MSRYGAPMSLVVAAESLLENANARLVLPPDRARRTVLNMYRFHPPHHRCTGAVE